MTKNEQFSEKISIEEGLDIIKISMQNNDDQLNEFLCVFKENIEHLKFWIGDHREVLFDTIYDIKKHYENGICYGIVYNAKIIGCIDIGKKDLDEDNLHYRGISYWIDKNHVRKGIMFKCLKSVEDLFVKEGLDRLYTSVERINTPSVNLLEKWGFNESMPHHFLVNEKTGKMWWVYHVRKNLRNKARVRYRRKKKMHERIVFVPNFHARSA